MEISESVLRLKQSVPGNVEIVAVSKTMPVTLIMEAYNAGLRAFGENKVQELIGKRSQLPDDIQWHFIGHLQTNKIRHIAPFINLIHSVDSQKLLIEIDREAKRNNRVIDCLLQFYIATEETKFGLNKEEVFTILRSEEYGKLKNVRIIGVMGMGSFTDDTDITRKEFRSLREYFSLLKSEFFIHADSFRHISMGMSGDYQIAIEEGSTMIRVGTIIFGNR